MRYSIDKMEEWVKAIAASDRRAMSQAISLCERNDRRGVEEAMALLAALPLDRPPTRIMAITGPPGVGKSTFIASMGRQVIAEGRRLAVMSIDPSSTVSGGSILGDKVRMTGLMNHPDVYVRPSPSTGAWGGLHPRSYEVREVLRAAGFDYLMIETVGVGQSEAEVRRLVDMVVLLMQPGSGDDVQMIKRGIHEWADYFIINKVDGDMITMARQMKSQLRMTSGLSHSLMGHRHVSLHSAEDESLAANCWDEMNTHYIEHVSHQDLISRRSDEKRYWLEKRMNTLLLEEAKRGLDLDIKDLVRSASYPEAMMRLIHEMKKRSDDRS